MKLMLIVVYRVVYGPERMITVPPRHYCVVENPVAKSEDGSVIMENGQAKLLHADQEIRLAQVSVMSYSMIHIGQICYIQTQFNLYYFDT